MDFTWKDATKFLGVAWLVIRVVVWLVKPADRKFNAKVR